VRARPSKASYCPWRIVYSDFSSSRILSTLYSFQAAAGLIAASEHTAEVSAHNGILATKALCQFDKDTLSCCQFDGHQVKLIPACVRSDHVGPPQFHL
jgi:hypothetical protein